MTGIRNKRETVTTDPPEIKKTMKYYGYIYANKPNNWDAKDKCLKIHSLPKFI